MKINGRILTSGTVYRDPNYLLLLINPQSLNMINCTYRFSKNKLK